MTERACRIFHYSTTDLLKYQITTFDSLIIDIGNPYQSLLY
ncbi:hypothetical protein BACCAP_04765 [Pseudoflavonifractor capillosus ATCC 29799]|uniref:Uncharacterized protein n=1 Tax=Pseudoflavonifractor capillosus ATCC 29799 TaxID=411467 RepID=A6P2N3_9FIRM|nr:hypothetical protein BACCAP_04765 [Pseudoflavonifractor capillosus ATCC 29799]